MIDAKRGVEAPASAAHRPTDSLRFCLSDKGDSV